MGPGALHADLIQEWREADAVDDSRISPDVDEDGVDAFGVPAQHGIDPRFTGQ